MCWSSIYCCRQAIWQRAAANKTPNLFFAAIGGFGMLGCFTRIVLQMKKVHSGLLSVYAFSTRNFADIIREFEARMDKADYLVGWIDCFAKGDQIGRGQVHEAYYLHEGEDPNPAQTLRVENQELPDTLFGLIPKSMMWRLMKPFSNDWGMKLLNWAKYTASSTIGNKQMGHGSPMRVSRFCWTTCRTGNGCTSRAA